MAGLSSKAAAALTKVMSRTMFIELTAQERELQGSIKDEEVMNEGRERNAERILSVEKYVDGTEIWPKGDLFHNIVKHLDESGLRSSLTIVQSRVADLRRQETEYLEKDRLEHERTAPDVVYRPDIGRFDS